jgi:3-hydroxyisobutyrate dehydrogenase
VATIGFIGVGNMGRPMALNLVKAGHKVQVFDVVPTLVEEAAKGGCLGMASIKEAVSGVDAILTMLPASKHVEVVYLGAGDLLNLADKGTLLIESSTIAPEVSKKVARAAIDKGFEMIDAPVSGGTGGAQAGTLTFMVGGSKASFDKATPILSSMGKNIFHAGDSGAGQIAKICNNMLLAIHMIGTSEAINLGVKCGIDPKKLCEIMSKSSGRNWSLELYNPYPGVQEKVPSSNGYQGGFAVDLMAKDLSLALEAALSSSSPVPLGGLARELFQTHSAQGHGRLDFSSIITLLQGKTAT